MEGRFKAIRYFAYLVEIVIFYVVGQTPGLIPELWGGRPVLLLPAALSIAIFERETAAMGFGLLCGLLVDFGMGSALGFHALFLCVLCYAVSLMAGNLLKTNLLTAMLVAAGGLSIIFLLQWVFFYVMDERYGLNLYALTAHYLPRFLYTLALMPLFYYYNRAFAYLIKPRED